MQLPSYLLKKSRRSSQKEPQRDKNQREFQNSLIPWTAEVVPDVVKSLEKKEVAVTTGVPIRMT